MTEFFTETTLAIPMIQIILLMLISTLSLLFGKVRLALLANYIFILYWAYFFNRDLLLEMGGPDNFQYITVFYFLFGIIIILIAAFSFLFQKDHD
ncbi:MAG: hypothetical protein P8X90_18535 [Desulfobacterales bacterium]|jgi:hypothetical protein